MSVENVTLDIGISPQYWDIPPRAKIKLDGSVIFQGDVTEAKVITHKTTLTEGDHLLEIILLNKDGRRDTIIEDGKIVKDMLLNIDSVIIDDIELGFLTNSLSVYETESGEIHHNMVNMGWNGTFKLKFSSPIYVWLLENL